MCILVQISSYIYPAKVYNIEKVMNYGPEIKTSFDPGTHDAYSRRNSDTSIALSYHSIFTNGTIIVLTLYCVRCVDHF